MRQRPRAIDVHPMPRQVRHAAAVALAALLLAAIGGMFWWQDLQYSRPTPVPSAWRDVVPGTAVALPDDLRAVIARAGARPVLLHFFNPACPCSRFNLEHVRDLIRTYGDRVTVVAVLVEDSPDVLRRAYQALGLDVPFHVDDGRVARAVGAYSTPQAAVIDGAGHLVYRGNYNTTRYCRDRATEFARLALDATLAGRVLGPLPASATTAYGCPLRRLRAVGKGA